MLSMNETDRNINLNKVKIDIGIFIQRNPLLAKLLFRQRSQF